MENTFAKTIEKVFAKGHKCFLAPSFSMEMQKFFPWHPPGQPNIEAKNLEQGQPPSSKVFSFF
jgi:hypothetical protein